MKNNILNYHEFMFEGLVANFKKLIEVEFDIEADEHFFDRLARTDNEPDKEGNIIIDEKEVISDIHEAIKKIVKKNLFNNGLFWDQKNRNELNKDILIINDTTNLNTVIMVSKLKDGGEFKYKFTIKTVMRKEGFRPSDLQKQAEPIYVK